MRRQTLLRFVTAATLCVTGIAHAVDSNWQACQLGRKDPARSIPACAAVIANPATKAWTRANAYVSRGGAYQQNNTLELAVADFSEAIRLAPNAAYAWQDRGEAYTQLRDYAEAIADLDQAIRIDPKRAFRYHSRAVAYREKGDLDHALEDFSAAISLDRTHDFRFGDRGTVYLSLGRYNLAIADFDEVTKLNPTFAAAFWRRAQAYLALGDAKRALSESNRAVELDPRDPDAYANRAAAHEKLGEDEAARRDYRNVLDLRPNDPAALSALAAPATALGGAALPRPQSDSTPREASCAGSGRRVALVVGNGAYPQEAYLTNPVNDSDDVSAILRDKLCFSVITAKNVTLAAFSQKIGEFAEAANGADVALFYYAGHGMQFQQTNLLLPIDAKLANEYDAIHENVSAQDVVAMLESRAKVTLVFLDACRNNPIEDNFRRQMKFAQRGFGETRGLAPMVARGSETLLVYATRPNDRADDGGGRNSPFTLAFLKHIATPGKDIELVMRDVTATVRELTGGRQVPQRLTELEHGLVLLPLR